VNIVYGLTTGDDTEPIPTNTGSQSADIGVLLRGLFKSPANIRGLFKSVGAETATFIKGATGTKTAVIGAGIGEIKGMDRVNKVAAGLLNAEVFNPSEAAQIQWKKLLADNPGKQLSDDVVKGALMFKQNVDWINKVKKEGYDILDIGGTNPSTFYNMEKRSCLWS
jgi:hypothetical protein